MMDPPDIECVWIHIAIDKYTGRNFFIYRSLFIKKNAIYIKKTATNYHKIYRNREFKIAMHVKV